MHVQILADLVNGEYQQMVSRRDQKDWFQVYLDKTFNNTASLIAYFCKSVVILPSEGTGNNSITDITDIDRILELLASYLMTGLTCVFC